MPTCAADGCSNSSKKKFKMNSFPRNPIQRAKWINNLNRKNWIPHDSSALCEVHFEPHMWEKQRVDGTKKLKCNAVPTIFGDRIVKESSLSQLKIENIKKASIQPTFIKLNSTIVKNSPTAAIMFPSSAFNNTQGINSIKKIQLNNQGKIAQIALTSILKPQEKFKNIQTVHTAVNENIESLKNQIKIANSQTPIIIPASASILKSKVQTNNLQSSRSTQLNIQILDDQNNESNVINNEVFDNNNENDDENGDADDYDVDIEMKETELTDSNDKSNITAQPIGIILNKAVAKKIEDERFEKMDKLLLKQLRLNNALRKKLITAKHKLQQLVKEQQNDHKAYLKDVFTEDQIRALELRYINPKSVTAWSHKTMMKAIKLKQECGTRGYEELLNQKMPLPSIRTISRWCTTRNIPIP